MRSARTSGGLILQWASDPRVPLFEPRRKSKDSSLNNECPYPNSVQNKLNSAGLNHRPIRLSIDTDVSLDGHPHRHWLIATNDHLSIVAEPSATNTKSAIVRSFPWESIQSVRTVAGVGSGLLQARIADQWVDLLRYSNALGRRFHKVSRRLESYAGFDQASESTNSQEKQSSDQTSRISDTRDEVESFDPPKCPECKLRLSENQDSCPRCLQRSQILQRVWILLRPHWRGGFILCLLTFLGVVAELIPPKLQQYMVDHC